MGEGGVIHTTIYHPKEMGAHSHPAAESYTGLMGVICLLGILLYSLGAALVSLPVVLLGVAEVVMVTPTHWRVRWIRRS